MNIINIIQLKKNYGLMCVIVVKKNQDGVHFLKNILVELIDVNLKRKKANLINNKHYLEINILNII